MSVMNPPAPGIVETTRARVVETHATLAGVTRYFRKSGAKEPFHALGPIDLTLAKGEFFSVVGPSGCGKSTLLEAFAGLDRKSTRLNSSHMSISYAVFC